MAETRYLTADEAEETRSYLRAFREDTGLSGHDIGRMLDVHHSTINHIIDGKDRPSPELRDRLLMVMREYRAQHQEKIEQDASGRALAATPVTAKASAAAGFQPTKCARTVIGTLDFAARKRLSGGIFGDPGVGKTAAVRQWSATTKHAHLVVTCRAYTSYTKLLQAIARGIGLGDGGTSLGDLDEMAHEALTARPRLLVIDEADMLNARTLDWLRTFQDESRGKTNVVYLGKPAFYRRLQVSHVRSAQDLRQVWSRLAFRRFLGGIDRGEVVAAVAAHGLTDAFEPQALDVLYDAVQGSYRDLEMTLALVEQIVEENPRLGGKVSAAVVSKATESRFGADMGKRGAR